MSQKQQLLILAKQNLIHNLLNKYLLVIVGVLIAFAILLSTLLINKTSDLRRLENKLKKENVAVFVDLNDELEEEQNGKIKNI